VAAAAGPCLAKPRALPISEAELAFIWQGQRYPPGALTWADGTSVVVSSPGRPGRGPGPDFRDAVVRIGTQDRKGDVEVHLRASGFRAHGHQWDPAYDRLVLHVVFEDDAGGETRLAGGGVVPVASFAPWVKARAADIASWLQREPLWREPCAEAVGTLGPDVVYERLRAAGEARFRKRAAALAGEIAVQGPDQTLWAALLDGLGYGGDRDGFRRLAGALPLALLRQETGRRLDAAAGDAGGEREAKAVRAAGVALAVLLSVAGLTPPAPGLPRLAPPLRAAGRPANHPAARLGSAAGFFALTGGEPARFAAETLARADCVRTLRKLWSVPGQDAGFRTGQARLVELLINAVLPFVAAMAPGMARRCLDFAAALPAPGPYGKTRLLESNLNRGGRRVPAGALEQQGLLAVHADWCSQGGCGRCPLSRQGT
jgi:hypothetical protein